MPGDLVFVPIVTRASPGWRQSSLLGSNRSGRRRCGRGGSRRRAPGSRFRLGLNRLLINSRPLQPCRRNLRLGLSRAGRRSQDRSLQTGGGIPPYSFGDRRARQHFRYRPRSKIGPGRATDWVCARTSINYYPLGPATKITRLSRKVINDCGPIDDPCVIHDQSSWADRIVEMMDVHKHK